jgi:rRNA processing protein Krr1/Pno1
VDKINPTFQARLQKRPGETVRLIVHVAGDMSLATTRLTELGATVLRSFTLIKAVSVACSTDTALALLQEPWVQALEEDRKVSTQEARPRGKGRKT